MTGRFGALVTFGVDCGIGYTLQTQDSLTNERIAA